MKLIKFIMALMLYSTIFISCSNTETDEELQMHIDNQELRAEDTGNDGNPPPPPTKPPGL